MLEHSTSEDIVELFDPPALATAREVAASKMRIPARTRVSIVYTYLNRMRCSPFVSIECMKRFLFNVLLTCQFPLHQQEYRLTGEGLNHSYPIVPQGVSH